MSFVLKQIQRDRMLCEVVDTTREHRRFFRERIRSTAPQKSARMPHDTNAQCSQNTCTKDMRSSWTEGRIHGRRSCLRGGRSTRGENMEISTARFGEFRGRRSNRNLWRKILLREAHKTGLVTQRRIRTLFTDNGSSQDGLTDAL